MSPLQIYRMFGNKLVGTPSMRSYVCDVVSKMPDATIKYVTENCWFMASMEDAYAFTFSGSDLKDKHLVFLSDDLLNQEEEQILYTIAHEIGHVVLGHRNSVFEKQSKNEVANQERAADEFAKHYL